MASNKDVSIKLSVDNNKFITAIAAAQVSMENLGKSTNVVTGNFKNSSKATDAETQALMGLSSAASAVKIAMAAVGVAILAVAGYSIKQAGEMEQLGISYKVMLGSASLAKTLLKDMQNYSMATPFDTKTIARAGQTLMQFGVTGGQVMPMIRMIGDVTGGSSEKMQSMSLAFGQMSAAGRLMGQDLLQMVNAGFNPLQEISAKTGKSMGVLKDEMAKGKISIEMVKDAFVTATSEGGRFYGMLAEQSQSTFGLWSTYVENVQQMGIAFGTLLEPAVKNAIITMTQLTSSIAQSIQIMVQVEQATGNLSRAFQNLSIVLGVMSLTLVIANFAAFIPIINAAATAVWGFVTAALAIPGLGAAVAIGAITAAILAFANGNGEANDKIAALIQKNTELNASAQPLLGTYNELKDKTKLTKDETERLAAAKTELIRLFPSLISQINSEKDITELVTLAMRNSELQVKKLAMENAKSSAQTAQNWANAAKRIQASLINMVNSVASPLNSLITKMNTLTGMHIKSVGEMLFGGKDKGALDKYADKQSKTYQKTLSDYNKAVAGSKTTFAPYTAPAGGGIGGGGKTGGAKTGGGSKAKGSAAKDTTSQELTNYKSMIDAKTTMDDQFTKLQLSLATTTSLQKLQMEQTNESKKYDFLKSEAVKLGVTQKTLDNTQENELYNFHIGKAKTLKNEELRLLQEKLNETKIKTNENNLAIQQQTIAMYQDTLNKKQQIEDNNQNIQFAKLQQQNVLNNKLGLDNEILVMQQKSALQLAHYNEQKLLLSNQGIERTTLENALNGNLALNELNIFRQTLSVEQQEKFAMLQQLAASSIQSQTEVAQKVQQTMQSAFQGVLSAGQGLFSALTSSGQNWGDRMFSIIKNMISLISNAMKMMSLMNGVKGASGWGSLLGGLFKGSFASGGIIPGSYSQATPIMGHGNEMVLNPGQQARLFAAANGEGNQGNNNAQNNQQNSQPIIIINNNIQSLEPQTAAKLVKDQMPYIEGQLMESMSTKSSMRGAIKRAVM